MLGWFDFSLFTPEILALVMFAVLLAGFAKGGFGGALASLCVPIMALGMSPLLAVSVLLPVLCLIDLFTIRAYWGKWDVRCVLVLVPAALVGVAVGWLAFSHLSAEGIKLIIGIVAVSFALRQLQVRLLASSDLRQQPPGSAIGRFWGMLAGFTSHVAHAGGVAFSVWLIPQGLSRQAYVATSAVFFITVNYVKLVPYALNNQFSASVLTLSISMIPLAIIGVLGGVRLNRFVPDRIFYLVISFGLLITGVKLLVDAGIALL